MLTHLHEQLCPQDRPTWGISLSSSFPGPAHVGHLALFLLPWTAPCGASRSLPPSLILFGRCEISSLSRQCSLFWAGISDPPQHGLGHLSKWFSLSELLY